MNRQQVHAIVADTIHKDRYSCIPAAAAVLAAPQHQTHSRIITGRMPHYGFYEGPMHYRVGVVKEGRSNVWLVMVNIALQAPDPDAMLELPDCALQSQLSGASRCEGTPSEEAAGTDACPDTLSYRAPASRANVRVLLEYWSHAIEGYFNRDARHEKLPVRYDFHFFLDDDAARARRPVDWVLPLHTSCARTPYFRGLRAGWSVPILAHEMAHFLGLLDEYSALSGITSLYPKDPFEGSETSRMGLSMKTDTHFFPLHHYLVLRRYHCDLDRPDPYSGLLVE